MRKILLLIFTVTVFLTNAQSSGDGCMNVRFVATQAYNQEYEDPFFNDESNWQWWFADVGNIDGLGWSGGQCLAQGGFFQIGWWNHSDYTVYNQTFGVAGPNGATVPGYYRLRGAYEGDDCGSSCDSQTGFFNCFGDDDDYRYDETVSNFVNYRFAAPNSNNIFQRVTTIHGSSDFGGEFYVRYTSPRPLVTASTTQICTGTSTNVTLNFTGAAFGGNYVVYDGPTPIYNSSSSSTTVNINSSKTYNVYTSNGGVQSLCYSTITINAVNCDFNCVTNSNITWNASFDVSQGTSPATSYTSPGDFPSNSYISDIDVDINFLKTDGSCATPLGGAAFHGETHFRLDNSSLGSISLVDGNFVGNTSLTTPITMTFDEDAATSVSGYNVGPGSNGAVLDPIGNLDAWNWNIISSAQSWRLWGGDDVALDPLCTNFYNLTVCGCKTANFGTATVNGNSSAITICENDPGTITLSHNGSSTGFDNQGYGDELRWFSGSCGGAFIGSGLSINIPSPTTTTTYYASFYIDGTPCRGSNSFCEAITVNVTPNTVPGTISPVTQTICVGDITASNVTLSGFTGTISSWEYSADGGGTWSPTGAPTSSTFAITAFLNLPGTHLFRAQISNGVCGTLPSPEATLIVNPNPVGGTVNSPISMVCSDSSFVLNANGFTGDIQWQESTINGTSGFSNIPGETSPSYGDAITNLGSTPIQRWYRLEVSNSPCTTTAFSNVIQIEIAPQTNPGVVSGLIDTVCETGNPGNLSLTGHIGDVQNWLVSFNGGAYTNIVNTNSSYTPGVLNIAGLYTYAAVVKSGACDADTSATFSVRVLPTVTASISGLTEVCEGQSITLTASVSGGNNVYSYQWQRNGVNVGTNSSSLAVSSALSAAMYNYTVIVNSGPCQTTSAAFSVTVHPRPVFSNVTTQNLTCYGVNIGQINIVATADSFSIDNGVTFSASNTFTGLAAGNYNLVVKNLFDCFTTYAANPVVITQPDSTSITFSIIEPNCATSNDGEIQVNASGGTPGFEYSLNGGAYQGGNTFTGLAPGTFTISVRDNNGCIYSKDTTLTAQYTFDLVIDSLKDVSCPGSADGFIELGTVGGVSPFSYSSDNVIFHSDSVFSNLVAGNYTFYALDSNGCSDVVSANIIESPPIQIQLDSLTTISCAGADDASIYVTVSGSTTPYQLDWTLNGLFFSNSEDLINVGPGAYNLTVTTSPSCIQNFAINVVEPNVLNANVIATSNVSCNTFNDGSIQASVSGGTPGYVFTWYDAANATVGMSQNLSGVGAGTYLLAVTDANGCTDSTSATTITEPAAIAVGTGVTNPSCSNSNNGVITVTVGGGTSPFTYSLNGGASQPSNVFSGLSAGSYVISIVDANGCTGTGNAVLTNQYSLTLAVDSQTNVSCAGQNDGTVALLTTGGQSPFTYSINGGSGQASNVFTGLAPGLYNFEVVDVNGCSATTSTTITSTAPLSFTLDSTDQVLCNGDATGAIYVSASGGSMPYSYSLNGGSGQASGSFTGLLAGSYTVTITDANGCTENLSATVTEPTALSASVTGSTNVSCNTFTDGSIQASVSGGTPGYTFTWYDAANATVGSSQNLSGVGAGTYLLAVTDANGCTDSTSATTITEPAAIAVVTGVTDPSCSNSNDGDITVTVGGGTSPFTYSLNGGASQPSNVFSGLSAGSYTITVTDANGCTGTGNAVLTNQYSLTLAVDSQTNVSCAGQNDGTVALLTTGGQSPFTYSINGGSGQASNVFTGLAPGLYNFEVVDVNGCSATTSTTITSTAPLSFTLDSTDQVLCNGDATGAIYVSASGGSMPYSYSLNGGSGQASGSFTGLLAGSYTVTITDANGCTENLSATVTEPTALSASVTGSTNVSCNTFTDGSIQASVSGGTPGYTFTWYDAANATVGSSQNLSGVGAGTYLLAVTDANGCTDSTSATTITEPAAIAVVTGVTDPSCSNSNDGDITVTVGGGTSPFTYSLNGGASQPSNVFSGLSAGSYTITVTDANGCTGTGNAVLTNQYSLTLAVDSQTNVSCAGQNDGTVALLTTGGQSPFTYSINGGSGQASNVFTGLAPGLYNFEVVDVNGCSATTSTTITSTAPLSFTLDSTDQVLCNGDATGAIYVSASGGSMPYSYSLNGGSGQASGSFTGLLAGSYTVTITDANGCTENLSATVTEPTALSASVTGSTNVSCNTFTDGSIQASVSGGTPGYTFTWYDAANATVGSGQNLSGVGAGTYLLAVTDANGCTDSTSATTITEPAAIAVVTGVTDPSCSNSNDGDITVTVGGGTSPFTYSLNGGASQPSNVFSGLSAGSYTITVTDANGCTGTGNAVLTNQYSLTLAVDSQTNVSCAGQNDGTVALLTTGGQSPFTYSINGGSGQASNVFTGLAPGLYNFEVVDVNGCSATTSTTITSTAPLSFTLDSTDQVLCNGDATGAIYVSASGGSMPYSYSLNGGSGQASGSFTGLLAGSYTVTITDANGCTENLSATVTEPTALSASVTGSTNVSCNTFTDGSIQASVSGGTPGYTFTWYDAANATVGSSQNLSGVGAGTYLLAVTDANGCTDSTSATTITEPAAIAVVTGVTDPSCSNSNDGDITVTVGGGTSPFTYSLNGGASQPSNVFSGLSAGSYTITVTDANGCTGTGNAVLTNQYSLTLAVDSQTNVSCAGQNDGTVALLTTGGQSPFTYSINGGAGQASNVFTGLAPGLYNFEVVDVNGCSATTSTTITSTAPLSFTLDSTDQVLCNGDATGAIYVSASGGSMPYSYSLNGGSGQASGSFTGLLAGSYTVTITDANGCTENLSATVTEPTALSASVTGSTNVSCNTFTDGSIQASVSGGTPGYTFTWYDAANATVGSSQNLSGVGAGTYLLAVTDANGCTDSTSATTITEPAAIAVVTGVTDPSCSNSNDGDITVTVGGGTSPFTYSLNGGASQPSNVFSGLSAGSYTITVTDANGCTGTGNAVLTNQYSLTLAVDSQTNVSCAGQNDGTVALLTTGGQSPFTYSINGGAGQASNVFTGLAPGLYNFEVVDVNGCSATTSTTITSTAPLSFTLDSTDQVLCNGDATGAIYVSASGGSMPYSYSLNGGSGQASGSFTGLLAGSYTVTITDANGCTENLSATVTEPTALSASVTGSTNVSCNTFTDGSIQASVSGGTPGYTFTWYDAANATVGSSQNLSGVGAGTYLLAVTDANGCTDSTSAIAITEPAVVGFSTSDVNPSCANSSNGSITVNATGGTPPYSYVLDNGASQLSNVFSGLSAGTYQVSVFDVNGCNFSSNITLSNQYTLTLAVQSQTNVSCAGQNDGTVTLQETGGQSPFTYSINGGVGQASNLFTGLAPGLYNFEVVDVNGCSATTSTTITSNPPISFTLDSVVDVLCNGQNSGSIHVSASGGSTPYSYSINGGTGQLTGSFTGLTAGSYTVTVTDNNGCTENISAVIVEPNAIALVIANYSDILCSGDTSGYIDVSVAGGTAPYTFSWSDGLGVIGNAEDIYNLGVGTYTLTVTDDNGCTATISQSIASPAPLAGNITTSDELCFGDQLGSAVANISGGTLPYTYLWSTFENTDSIGGLSGGLVSVLVTDANGCQITLFDTIGGPQQALEIELIKLIPVTCFGGNNGQIQTDVVGGTSPYTISWAPTGDTTLTIINLTAGSYTLTVVDANGCTVSETYIVSQAPEIVSSVSVTNPSCFGQETGTALVGASGGTPPFTYEWNTTPIQNGALANNLAGDTSYVVSITDFYGCITYDTAVLVNPAAMQVSATPQGVTCIADVNGEVAIIVNGGNAPYTYQLNGLIQTDSIFDNLAVGTYVVFVVDNNNCNASTQFDIIQNPVLEIDLLGAGNDGVYWSDDLYIIRGEQVDLLVDVLSSGIPVASTDWIAVSSGNLDTTGCGAPCLEPTMMPEEDLTVTVNVLDTNGCVVTDTLRINVSQEAQFFMPSAFTPNGDCLNDNFEINVLGASNLDVRIFNRWGEELFHNPNQANGMSNPDDIEIECLNGNINPREAWDGTFKGEPMPNGAYTYQIDVTMFDGTIRSMSGTVTILR